MTVLTEKDAVETMGQIVARNYDLGLAVLWNGRKTFNLLCEVQGGFENTECHQRQRNVTEKQARAIAQEWIDDELDALGSCM